jgi:hypothetical protein
VQGGAGCLPAGAAADVAALGWESSLALAAEEEAGAFGSVGMRFTLLKGLKETEGRQWSEGGTT